MIPRLSILSAVVLFACAAVLLSGPARAASVTVTYSYDSLGRLVQASYPSNHAENYAYDNAGNRKSSSTK